MKHPHDANSNGNCSAPSSKPSAILGAGRLTATVWNRTTTKGRRVYRFNVFRTSVHGGCVTQKFAPTDISDLVRLAQLLAFEISDDGYLEKGLRDDLTHLATHLEIVLSTNPRFVSSLPTEPQ